MVVIETLVQSVQINGVSDVAVTAIAHDDVEGDFYRDIRFFGEPDEGVGTVPVVFTVRIRASTVEPLRITVPEDEF